ncbi:nucleotidyltransferase domain-containing protein [Streptomyces sp. NPDC052225]|uniref:nucleotidyltransferase domain-containing protein n=1 Tax=Streptomyces sp. NPDC052225 TaxID=3154949 RepID=UPI003417D38A
MDGTRDVSGVPVSVRRLLPDLLTAVAPAVGERMVGVWLYGSAATGSFDRGISDVDVLVGVSGELDLAADELDAAHRRVLRAHLAAAAALPPGHRAADR